MKKIIGEMMVNVDGKELTLPQAGVLLGETDRFLRQRAWEGIIERRYQEKDQLDLLFDRMLELRNKIALNAGFASYREYIFVENKRFDYTSEDCLNFHEAVEKVIIPLLKELNRQRVEDLKVSVLRPWDMEVDPLSRPPLRPFKDAEQLAAGASRIITKVDPELGEMFKDMIARGELDLESRAGKAPGGYQIFLDEVRRPFIFTNAAGTHGDVMTMLHEAGHSFHSLLCRLESIKSYRESPIEFAEVASQTMELFGLSYLDEFYSGEELERAKRQTLEDVLQLFPWIARVDAFQHWIYTNPSHTHEERDAKWVELAERFSAGVDWSGYEQAQAKLWHKQLHIFTVPFYYIEYGISELGAIGLWMQFKADPQDAVSKYRSALSLGGARPLPELFAAAGLPWDFGAKTIEPLVGEIKRELGLH